jgi:hypothetical protein
MPDVQHQKSHYLLPLNSMLFKSKSSSNLPSTNQRNIYTRSTTTLANVPVEQPDDELTALPPVPALPLVLAPAKPIRRKAKKQHLAVTSLRSQGSAEHHEDVEHPALRRSKSMVDLEGSDVVEGDKKKESVWRRLVEALKKPFRKDKEPVAQPKEMVIGGPTDFKHLQTGTACLPSQPELQKNDTEEDTSGDWETVRPSESTFRPSETFFS